MHDFAVTKEHAIFPGFPITADLARIKAGGPHWSWDASKETFVGVMPRDGSVDKLRWFRGPACSVFHIVNSYTEGSKVHMDLCVSNVPVFGFIRDAAGMTITPDQLEGSVERWTFDLSKPGDEFTRQKLADSADMPRTATTDMMRDYSIAYLARFNPQSGAAHPQRPGRRRLQRAGASRSEERPVQDAADGPDGHDAGTRAHPFIEAGPRRLARLRGGSAR